ncbi:glutathione S-transferase [Rhodobium orientis]|uniref:Glutathione S-transferase n=1 Tax=Rhodobium orientis TaxID=34017 RepID=A0A327JFD6_9HYPH|nr:glutathione S-transferase family protein [Rhodobium orientis]MBB4301543.1 glutathione S-transferase [Rhodobium orientis]MBK5952240.1 glutathione S-transferase [Rhodobium orientis]RAI24825.1 glutathione S-transferase [Rhodobium orientis]
MKTRQLIIGNKNYSSWSLRPWLAMSVAGIEFEEVLIPLDQPDTKEKILQYSPAGKVPILIDGDLTVWESLAILEYLAEAYPGAGLWPDDPVQRAEARSVSAEMHAGFGALRDHYPMNVRKRIPGRASTPAADKDIARITEIWRQCLEASQGPFLFGSFTAADAMFAPVVSRFETYDIPVDDICRSYMDDVLTIPVLEKWYAAGEAETWILEHDEVE